MSWWLCHDISRYAMYHFTLSPCKLVHHWFVLWFVGLFSNKPFLEPMLTFCQLNSQEPTLIDLIHKSQPSFSEICIQIEIYTFLSGITHLKRLSTKCQPFISDHNVFNNLEDITHPLNSCHSIMSYFCGMLLTHWGRDKMAAFSQTTLSNAFSWMKIIEFRLKFHWSLFLRVLLTIFQHWFW